MSKSPKSQARPFFEEVIYPESDGKPMAETDIHCDCMIDLREALKDFFRNEPDVYVAGNLFVYYQRGDTRRQVAPDVFVVKGVEKKKRRYYQIWKEGKAPDMVIEVTSDSTRWEDMDHKRKLYHQLGVKEYYLFDPTGDYLKDQLLGYRLVGNRYVPVRLPKGRDRLHSDVLGLDLVLEVEQLRLYDPQTQRFLLTPSEAAEARRQAEIERAREAQARQQAEAERRRVEEENARLRAEMERMRKQLEATARAPRGKRSKKD
jgi:Uma2 family endonuclease